MDFKRAVLPYYVLSKPGIIYANVITAAAGYLFASRFHIVWLTVFGLLVGLSMLIAGACAFNNYLDRGIDAHMKRTKSRSLVTGALSPRAALTFASVASILGLLLLVLTQNRLTVILTIVAFVDYVVLYGLAKRKTVHGTLVGCVSGAIPLMAGYTAFTGQLTMVAWLLFMLMVAWQMGHFYGIALYRQKDYAAANIPVMPVVYGARSTKIQTLVYIGLFIVISALLLILGYTGIIAGIVLCAVGVVWLTRAVRSYSSASSDVWGKQVFLFSLIVMLSMSAMLSVGPLLA